jgi:ACS family hexuronate transporter-like MFS transporter
MDEIKTTGAEAEVTSLSARIGNVRWSICAMLFVATTINYMDRQVIGLLKPILQLPLSQGGIGMTELSYGYVVDAFQVAYAAGVLLAGYFVDKVGTRIGYMVIMALWSLSAMGHALANTVFQFGIARFCLGIGESGNFPAAIKTVSEWFPQSERSLATGIFNSGANVGAIIAPILIPIVYAHYGWHAAFLVTGFFSMSWILLWFLTYHKPTEHPRLTKGELDYINADSIQTVPDAELKYVGKTLGNKYAGSSWINLLGFRQTWAFAIGKFLTDPIWWFYLFWLPGYFSARYGLDLKHIGLPLIIVYNATTIGSVGGGWLPTPFRKFGFSAAKARMAAMLLCALCVVPVFFISFVNSVWAAVALLSLAAAAHQGWSANIFTTVSDMFPRSAVGSVTGIGAMAGSVGGVLLATSTGYILQATGSYFVLFGIAASAYIVAFLIIITLAPGLKRAELNA